jgi:hypothetical protein
MEAQNNVKVRGVIVRNAALYSPIKKSIREEMLLIYFL